MRQEEGPYAGMPEYEGCPWSYTPDELEDITELIFAAWEEYGWEGVAHSLMAINDEIEALYPEDIEQILRIHDLPITLLAIPMHTVPNDSYVWRAQDKEELPFAIMVLTYNADLINAVDLIESQTGYPYEANIRKLKRAGLASPMDDEMLGKKGRRINTFSVN